MPIIDTVKDALGLNSSAPNAQVAGSADAQTKLPELPDQAVFDHERVTVIFVLGGPGAGTFLS